MRNALAAAVQKAKPNRVVISMTIKLVWSPSLWTVVSSGCWEWNGCRSKDRDKHGNERPRDQQYGWFGRNGLAHRYALALKLGRPILPGLMACHHCDNPSCVNPDHLYEGTASDNMQDKWDRDRHPRLTHCKTCGMEWTEATTLIDKRGKRRCRNCNRVASREKEALVKQAKEALGLTHVEYRALYGQSNATALAIIADPESARLYLKRTA
jgi:hypothetical protein